jgi:iron(III) transport system substrate-binding protein
MHFSHGYDIRVWLSLALLLLQTHASWAQSDPKLVEAAKKEGKLAWYTSTSVTESKPLLDDFEKLYPFIKGEILRASGEKTLNRIMTESRAGRWDFDVVTISEVDAPDGCQAVGALQIARKQEV